MPRDLTARQLQVVAMIADGMSTRTIASELEISPAGVRMHLGKIYERLNVNNRVQVARWWLERQSGNGK